MLALYHNDMSGCARKLFEDARLTFIGKPAFAADRHL